MPPRLKFPRKLGETHQLHMSKCKMAAPGINSYKNCSNELFISISTLFVSHDMSHTHSTVKLLFFSMLPDVIMFISAVKLDILVHQED